jgi:hypothetical protein
MKDGFTVSINAEYMCVNRRIEINPLGSEGMETAVSIALERLEEEERKEKERAKKEIEEKEEERKGRKV